jgi:hypothetical protein
VSKTNKNTRSDEDRRKDPKRKFEHREDRKNTRRVLEEAAAILNAERSSEGKEIDS